MFAPLHVVLALAQASGWAHQYPPRIDYAGITPAERNAATATLGRLEALLRQVPELTNATEFLVKKQYLGGHRSTALANSIAAYSLKLWFFRRIGPGRVFASEGATCIEIGVNAGPDGPKTDENGKPFDIEPERGNPLPGTTLVNGRMTEGEGGGIVAVFTQGGTFPWTPLTREQYLRAQIYEFGGIADKVSKTPYEEWMAGAAQRKKDRDDLARQLQGIQSKEEIKNTIAQQEKQELQMTEELKARDAEDRLRNQQAARISTGPGDDLRARLAAMSAEERAKPAMVYRNWEMPTDGTPNTFRVLSPILDYWRVRRSPVELRTIVVQLGSVKGSGTCGSEAAFHAIWQTYRKLDWAAFKQMVETSP